MNDNGYIQHVDWKTVGAAWSSTMPVIGTGLETYSTEALEARFDILHAHDDRLANDREYMLDVINGFESDPRDGFDLDDPWNNWAAIDRELGNR